MGIVEWMLIHGADLIRAFGSAVVHLFSRLGSVLHDVLQPILSPLLSLLNPISTSVGDFVYALLDRFETGVGLTVISAITGIVMLLAFRYLSNQAAIGRAKDDIKANLLALKLYKDELHVTFLAQWRLFKAIVRLQRYVLTPVLVLLLPMLLLLAQMGLRYEWRPLRPGERIVVTVTLDRNRNASGRDLRTTTREQWPEDADGTDPPVVSLPVHPGVVVEVAAVPGGGTIDWRLRAVEPGRHILEFLIGGQTLTKELVVSDRLTRISAKRTGPDWTAQLLHPAEPILPADCGVRSIEIAYPGGDSRFHGPTWWIVSFFVISMVTALVLKPFFKVRF